MELKQIVGIDIGKETFDAFIEGSGKHIAFPNSITGFKQFVKWLKQNRDENLADVLIVMEHTGIYSFLFEKFLHQAGILLSKVSGLKIKKSAGLVRGKSDKADARKIAQYGVEKHKQLKTHEPVNDALLNLKNLITLRDKMVRDRAGYITRWKEQKEYLALSMQDVLIQTQQAMIKAYDKQIETVEKEIDSAVKSEEHIRRNFELLTSIKGVGPVIATYMIAFTENFTSFSCWRKFACYCGLAPFPYESGTSIKGKTKVSFYANKKLKSLLHLAALTAVQFNPEMKAYYERRTAKGKNKMSTLNVIRNKIVSRIFAVVSRGSEYKIDWLVAA